MGVGRGREVWLRWCECGRNSMMWSFTQRYCLPTGMFLTGRIPSLGTSISVGQVLPSPIQPFSSRTNYDTSPPGSFGSRCNGSHGSLPVQVGLKRQSWGSWGDLPSWILRVWQLWVTWRGKVGGKPCRQTSTGNPCLSSCLYYVTCLPNVSFWTVSVRTLTGCRWLRHLWWVTLLHPDLENSCDHDTGGIRAQDQTT